MKRLVLVLLVLCSSLAMADVVQISDDTFVIRRTDKGGIFGNTARMRDKVLREADEFATERGKVAETVTISERGKGFMRFAEIEYTFRLVDAESTKKEEGKSIDLYTELKKLAELRDDGLITEAEFETEKKKLLDAN
jgi:hypothetical protein